MPKVIPGMLQGRQGLLLFLLIPSQAYFDRGMPRVRRDGYAGHIHGDQARVGKLESDDLGKLFPDCLRDSQGTMLIHIEKLWLVDGCWWMVAVI